MMTTTTSYKIMLQAGCGIVPETRIILNAWSPGVNVPDLCRRLLDHGAFPNLASRTMQNLVREGFAPRYLTDDARPALVMKALAPMLPNTDWTQLAYLYTARAVRLLGDYVREIYWPRYGAGNNSMTLIESREFVRSVSHQGGTDKPWSESSIVRNGGYLLKTLSDFGLVEDKRTVQRRILPYSIRPTTLAVLAYDLHLRGMGDNAVVAHEDWGLFGLNEVDVREELKSLARRDLLIIQSAGETVRISWRYSKWEEVLHVLTQG
jgi:hypothetical protein